MAGYPVEVKIVVGYTSYATGTAAEKEYSYLITPNPSTITDANFKVIAEKLGALYPTMYDVYKVTKISYNDL